MLEDARGFCQGIFVTADQLDPFQAVFGEDVEDDAGVLGSFYPPFLVFSLTLLM